MPFRAPIDDLDFILTHVVPLGDVAATGRFAEARPETARAVLEGAARVAEDVLAPLQRAGDTHPARLQNGAVLSPPGYAEGYRAMADGGWIGLSAPEAYGGTGLPQMLAVAVHDMFAGACLALELNPLLTHGQEHHGSDAQKATYLPKLISGAWSGTMNLTEPQAGTDLGALSCRAETDGAGRYRLTGQKIYISWGDCDFTGNVSHLVLARLPDAPVGSKGISLFLAPKFLPGEDGEPGARNALNPMSLEHKLGLHGAPTAVMAFEGATAELVGAPHQGLAAMFTMMNNARLGVGVQGVGVAGAAAGQALAHALERRQGRPLSGGTGMIFDHADVRRMLAVARAEIFATRALMLDCAQAIDMAAATGDPGWQARAALLTPIAKAHGTEVGIHVASEAMQVQGGMGYIEETGAAQFLRDVRVTAIYEGTNGIQAMDLVGRKMADDGAAALARIEEVRETTRRAGAAGLGALANPLAAAAEALATGTRALLEQGLEDRFAGAVPYLGAFARVLGAEYHLRAALAEGGAGQRTALARVHVERLLPAHAAKLAEAGAGAEALMALSPEALSG